MRYERGVFKHDLLIPAQSPGLTKGKQNSNFLSYKEKPLKSKVKRSP